LKNNPDLHRQYSENAEKASENYRRSNADNIVDYYLHERKLYDGQTISDPMEVTV
jgi:hypothetical protein